MDCGQPAVGLGQATRSQLDLLAGEVFVVRPGPSHPSLKGDSLVYVCSSEQLVLRLSKGSKRTSQPRFSGHLQGVPPQGRHGCTCLRHSFEGQTGGRPGDAVPLDAVWLPISVFPKAQVPAWSHSPRPPSLSLLEHLYPLSFETKYP